MQEQRFARAHHVRLPHAQHLHQQLAHLAELGEDQRLAARGVDLVEQVDQPLRLARRGGVGGALLQVMRRVVADLLEREDHPQHQPLPLEAARLAGDRREALAHDGLVQRGLLGRERAVLVLLELVGQVVDDPAVALEPAQHEGCDDPAQACGRGGVAVGLDRRRVLLREVRQAAEVAALRVVDDRPVLAEAVLDRGAAHRDAHRGLDRLGRAGLRRRRVLDVLRLVDDHRLPAQRSEPGGFAAQHAVGGQQQVGALAGELAPVAVVDRGAQRRGKPGRFLLPVGQQAGRHDHQRPAVGEHAVLLQPEQQREHLQRLAQAHVVGNHAAQAQPRVAPEPGVAALLVRPQRGLQARGRRQLDRLPQRLDQMQRRGVQADRRALVLAGQRGAQQVGAAQRGRAGQPLAQGLDLGGVEHHILAAEGDDALGLAEQALELRGRQQGVADRDPPVEAQQPLGVEQAAGAVAWGLDLHRQPRPPQPLERARQHGAHAQQTQRRQGLEQQRRQRRGRHWQGLARAGAHMPVERRVELGEQGHGLEHVQATRGPGGVGHHRSQRRRRAAAAGLVDDGHRQREAGSAGLALGRVDLQQHAQGLRAQMQPGQPLVHAAGDRALAGAAERGLAGAEEQGQQLVGAGVAPGCRGHAFVGRDAPQQGVDHRRQQRAPAPAGPAASPAPRPAPGCPPWAVGCAAAGSARGRPPARRAAQRG